MRAGGVAVSGIWAKEPAKGWNSRPSRRVGTSRPRAFFCHSSRRMGHLRPRKVEENEKIHKRRRHGCSTLARGEESVPIVHALILAVAAHAATPGPAPLRVQRISVAVPDPDRVQVTVHAAPSPGVRSGLAGQRLRLRGAPGPLDSPVEVTGGGGGAPNEFG